MPTRDLRLTRGPLLVGGGIVFVLLALAIVGLTWILRSSFEQLEAQQMQQRAAQIQQALEADLRQLDISNRDYADWDDAAAFLETHSVQFIAANFTRETLVGMRVDLIWIVDRQGREVYSCLYDRARAVLITPAPPGFTESVRRFTNGPLPLMPPTSSAQIVRTPAGPAAIAMRQIRRTDGSGPTGARLLFGRFIGNAEVDRINQTSQLPVTASFLDQPEAYGHLPAFVRDWLSRPDAQHRLVQIQDGDRVMAYSLVRAVDGTPVVLLATAAHRDIVALGDRTMGYLLGIVFLLVAALAAAVTWLLSRLSRSFAQRYAADTRFRRILDQIREAIVVVDPQSLDILEANRAVLEVLARDQVGQRSISDIFPELQPEPLRALAHSSGYKVFESRLRHHNGRWTDAEVTVAPAEMDGRTLLVLTARDVSHRKEAERRERDNRRRLVRVAQRDALTSLPNRAFLMARLPRALQSAASSKRLLALMYLDIDHFKNINDSLGHPQGDELLRTVAARLRATLAAQHIVVRIGGDEFVIVATLLPDEVSVEDLAGQLRTAVSAPIILGEQAVIATASIGVAIFPTHGADGESLFKHADIALYQAKSAGRNCHRIFAAAMKSKLSEQATIEQALHQALGTEQLFMHFQPIVDLKSGRVASLEALMRWNHPSLGMISPAQFIPIAEQSGVMPAVGELALQLVLRQLRLWLDQGVPIVPVAVNVSPLQLQRTDFPALVRRLTAQMNVEPKWLRFELTETAVMNEKERLIGSLQQLRKLGAQISIDDFGTGYSSLSYLTELPVDNLKIDRSFVTDLDQSAVRLPVIQAIVDMARQLRLATVAEGVETPEQAMLLLELGIDYAQGYLYSKAVSARACTALLSALKRDIPLTQTLLVRALAQSKPS